MAVNGKRSNGTSVGRALQLGGKFELIFSAPGRRNGEAASYREVSPLPAPPLQQSNVVQLQQRERAMAS